MNSVMSPPLKTNKREVLFQSHMFEVVQIEWYQDSLSAMHNHGWSQCFVQVNEGVFENTLDLGSKVERQILEAGQVLTTPVGARHEMRCISSVGKTLHVYVPRIDVLENRDSKFSAQIDQDVLSQLSLGEGLSIPRLNELLSAVQKECITTHSPFFMNRLFSGIFPQTLMAESLLAQTKATVDTIEVGPVFTKIESEVVSGLQAQLGWHAGAYDGVTVPGGSAANFMAVHLARHHRFPHIKQNGSSQSLKIFVSQAAHYSFRKACAVLGLGTDAVVSVPTDSADRMNPEALEVLIQQCQQQQSIPLMVCATAGTTVVGAFDPIESLVAICKKYKIWLHVDGAWGGPAIFSKRMRSYIQGIEFADSFTFDAHKLFGASLTCGFLLTRHKGLLLDANDVTGADYLFHSDHENLDRGKLSWQCGRKPDVFSFWTLWKNLGTQGLGDFVDRLLSVRDESVDWIKTQSRLELVCNPEFLNICVRVLPPESKKEAVSDWSRSVREVLKNKNQAFVNYSTDDKGSYLRVILTNPWTEFKHVQQALLWALEVQ